MLRSQTLGAALALAVVASSSACSRSTPPPKPDPKVLAGAELFSRYCALCHGEDAKGYIADHAPSLVTETFLATANDSFLSRSIREGRPGTAMAPYGRERGGPLAPEDVLSILAFLRSKGPPQRVDPPPVMPGDATRGQVIYDARCRRCHGVVGERGEAPHLANMTFLAAASDAFIRYAIVNGRPGTKMEAFRDALDEQGIADVVTLIRGWATPPPPAPMPQPQLPPDLPLQGPIVINPNGKAPAFKLREERFVSIDQVKAALDARNRIIIIDARPSSEWLIARIPGSLSVAYYQTTRLGSIPKDDTWVVAYCACPHHASGMVIDELRRRGFPHTAVLDEGILEWQKRNYPMLRPNPLPAQLLAPPGMPRPPHAPPAPLSPAPGSPPDAGAR